MAEDAPVRHNQAASDEEPCAICLETVIDRCSLPQCFHASLYVTHCGSHSCFECILSWVRAQKDTKRCPLCKTPIGSYIVHALDPTSHQYAIYRLRESSPVQGNEVPAAELAQVRTPPVDTRPRPTTSEIRQREEAAHRRRQCEALAFRRHIYRRRLYAKHVASNRYTRYRPYPGPAGFRANPTYARLLSTFLQRELQVWPYLDIPFLSFYIPAMLSHVDVQSDAMLDQLTEWIGDPDEARLLAHEMELFVRSGRGGLGLDQYDTNPWLQYDNAHP